MCPSEVSDVERQVWQRYRDQGVVVWGIASQDRREAVVRFQQQMGLTFPILFDEGSVVLNRFGNLRHSFDTVYPQDWVVGIDGRVAYASPGYRPEEMRAVIDAQLAR